MNGGGSAGAGTVTAWAAGSRIIKATAITAVAANAIIAGAFVVQGAASEAAPNAAAAAPVLPVEAAPKTAGIQFSEFKEINRKNYGSMTSGRMSVLQVEYEDYPAEVMREKVEQERLRLEAFKKRLADIPGISERMKAANIKAQESTMDYTKMMQAGEFSRTLSFTRDLLFDVPRDKYLIDSRPSDDATKAASNDSYKALRSGEAEVRFMTESDHAVILYSGGPIGADRRFPIYLGVLPPEMLSDPGLTAQSAEGTLNGTEVTILRVSIGNGGEMTLYVDPALGYRYRRVEFRSEGEVQRVLEADKYQLIDGQPFPMTHKDTSYYAAYPEAVKESVTTTVKSAEFKLALAPDVFKLDFSPRTTVFDTRLGLRFRLFDQEPADQTISQLSLDDIVKRSLDVHARRNQGGIAKPEAIGVQGE